MQVNGRLTLSALQTKPDTSANSVDQDETVHNELAQLVLHGLPFCFHFTDDHICSNGHIQIQGWKLPFHKYSSERVNSIILTGYEKA